MKNLRFLNDTALFLVMIVVSCLALLHFEQDEKKIAFYGETAKFGLAGYLGLLRSNNDTSQEKENKKQ
jgi:hypothetical protein